MQTRKLFVVVLIALISINIAKADSDPACVKHCPDISERQSLTYNLFGINDWLGDKGLELAVSATGIYQQNVKGGLNTNRNKHNFAGSYDLELWGDMQKIAGIKGGKFYTHAEGSSSEGINDRSVGSFFGVNGDAFDHNPIVVTELWYEQMMADDALVLRVGKIDLTGGFEHHNCPVAFDCSMFANDETTQFLNGALTNNPTIPFAERGSLAVEALYALTEHWYISGAVTDAKADSREAGFDTTFDGKSEFLYLAETGITPQFGSINGPLQGAYRVGIWVSEESKERFSNGQTSRGDTGEYLTFDQEITKENSDPNDNQGLGAFFRYGWSNGNLNDISDFWSFGIQYKGLFESRDNDVLGIAVAQGVFSNEINANGGDGFSADNETVFETYYNIQVTPWMHISPDVQYIVTPGGDKSVQDAVVIGLRAQITF